jgi:hypothetical protein
MQLGIVNTGSQLKAMELKKISRKNHRKLGKTIYSISIDCVVFGFHDAALKVLVLKLKEKTLWGLPGGFINKRKI